MKIRKALFRTLYVKSWSDVDRMLSLLSCSSTAFPSAASLMKHLIIIFDNSEAPWIHLPLKAISLNTEMKDVHIELHLQNYGPNLQQWAHSFDTIWYYQPHRFTWLTKTIQTLKLENMHFESAQDFFKLLSEFQILLSLKVKNITWASSAYTTVRPLPPFIRSLFIHQLCNDSHGTLGILPWFIFAGSSFLDSSSLSLKKTHQGKFVRRHTAPEHILHLLEIVEALRDPALCSQFDSKWCVILSKRIKSSYKSACKYFHHSI